MCFLLLLSAALWYVWTKASEFLTFQTIPNIANQRKVLQCGIWMTAVLADVHQ